MFRAELIDADVEGEEALMRILDDEIVLKTDDEFDDALETH